MLKSAIILLSKAQWAQKLITSWKIAWRVASRFVAGETTADAIQAIKQLNQQGILATVDHLGEHTNDHKAAAQAVVDIIQLLESIHTENLKSNVSIKLTQIGLNLDVEMTYENLIAILDKARENHNFVNVDMEDSSHTQVTLNLVLRACEAGFDNIGTVIQSYLYRSETDTQRLADRGMPVRLVKGAYKEPPSLAFPKKRDVDANLDRITEIMIKGAISKGMPCISADGRFPPMPALATHDEKRIEFAIEAARKSGLPNDAIEFQMLYGIRRDLQKELEKQGYPVRVYVPYGTQWYPYLMRRLAERPANIWFFLSNLFQR